MDKSGECIDRLIKRFEVAWGSGSPLQIEAILPLKGPERVDVLWELVFTEQELATKRGELRPVEEYLAKFPELREDASRLLELVCNEWVWQARTGHTPDLSDYQRRFPTFSHELAEYFAGPMQEELATQREDQTDLGGRETDAPLRCPKCHAALPAVLCTSDAAFECPGCKGSIRIAAEEPVPERTLLRERFRLIEKVGEGSFGSVWKAWDKQLDRTVALKSPRGAMPSERDRSSFVREAKASAGLRHDNIVTVFEIGQHKDDVFIVTSFVDGETLADWLARQRVTPREAAKLCQVIADALHHAHEHGVIHRDLKPHNIMVDSAQTLFLTDFGLARRETGDVTVTLDGQVLGTPAYMSPEQARGDAHTADRRSDIYSLGVILYEMLTGERPFRGSARMVIHQVLSDEPIGPRRLDSRVPQDLETICLRCMEKEAPKRYPTAAAVSEELERYLNGEPIEARPISKGERSRRWVQRHKMVSALSAAVIGTITLALIVVSSQLVLRQRADRDRTKAQVDSLLSLTPEAVPRRLEELVPYQVDVAPMLRQMLAEGGVTPDERARLQVALLPHDRSVISSLTDRMLAAPAREYRLLRDLLLKNGAELGDGMRETLGDPASPAEARLRAAGYLAASRESSHLWSDQQLGFIANSIIDERDRHALEYATWIDVFRPLKERLTAYFSEIMQDSEQRELRRRFACDAFVEYAASDLGKLVSESEQAEPWQLRVILPVLKDRFPARASAEIASRVRDAGSWSDVSQPSRHASLAIASLFLGEDSFARRLLTPGEDQTSRYLLVARMATAGVPADQVLHLTQSCSHPDQTSAALLMLGDYSLDEFSTTARTEAIRVVRGLHRDEPHAGIHAAACWCLLQWGIASAEQAPDDRSRASQTVARDQPTFRFGAGHRLVVLGPATFEMGSPKSEKGRSGIERRHLCSISRRFAIGMTEVTIEQYRRFREPPPQAESGKKMPVHYMSWSDAAAYCNWLSEEAGIPAGQWCYKKEAGRPNEMAPTEDCLNRTGYRLPTEAEWEYACRAGTSTARFFGAGDDLLHYFAWCLENSPRGLKRPVGTLRPNGFGLFDIFGNAIEHCHDLIAPYPTALEPVNDSGGPTATETMHGVVRGGAVGDSDPPRAATREACVRYERGSRSFGFRVARTLPE